MRPEEVIEITKNQFAEWLEMSDNPDKLLSVILSQKIIRLQHHIEYLEKRIEHANKN